MKCKNCGQEIDKKAVVCTGCGCKIKKPIYKKWWLWVIVAIIAISVSSGSNNDKPSKEKSNNDNQTTSSSTDAILQSEEEKTYKKGMYKIGTDMPAGEYKVEASASGKGYIEVSADSSHDLMSIVSNDNFEGEKYISVSDGQYIKFSRAVLRVNK